MGLKGELVTLPCSDAGHPITDHVTLDTIHRFKGLEAAVVILTGLTGLHPSNELALLYVGTTRARSHLIVMEHPETLAKYGLPAA